MLVPPGDPAFVTCHWGENYQFQQLHFSYGPYSTFDDPLPGLDSLCGDLEFEGRTRSFFTEYASQNIPEENPWKYWRRRGRGFTSGATVSVDSVLQISIDANTITSADVPMPLEQQYDAVGALLLLTNDGTLTPTDSAFVYSEEYPASSGVNLYVQHWRHIAPPTLDSVTVNGDSVTLYWENGREPRSIDGTTVYRDGGQQPIAVLASTATSYVDPNLAPATYTYTLKHVSDPIAVDAEGGGLPYPNSPSSNALQAIVEPPPPPLALEISGPDLITEDDYYTWTMLVTGGTTPYRPRRWDYKEYGTSTWTTVGTKPKYERFVRTTDPWFWLRAVVWDATGDNAGNKIVVETWDQGTMAEPLRAGDQVGVLLADGTCSPRPPVGDPGRQAWLRTIMETVSRIAYCVVEARTE